MDITKRNHYNPCFWTALWNDRYYEEFLKTAQHSLPPREQEVFALNVRGNIISQQKVENVHFEKGLGHAEITFEAIKQFVKRNYPTKYDDFCRNSDKRDYPIFWDFENYFTGLESSPAYKVLLDVAKRRDLASSNEKECLADFVYLQWLRSHTVLNSMIEQNSTSGIEKFECYAFLRSMLIHPERTQPVVARLARSHWTLYRTENDTFPLTDSPILVQRYGIMVALSPRLLLEISLKVTAAENQWDTQNGIGQSKFADFRRRSIGTTFREIIFSEQSVLENWQSTKDFRKRVALLKRKSYEDLAAKQLGLPEAMRNADAKSKGWGQVEH